MCRSVLLKQYLLCFVVCSDTQVSSNEIKKGFYLINALERTCSSAARGNFVRRISCCWQTGQPRNLGYAGK